ncbi:baseplate wedge protein [Leptolyngbya phage Lbo-JY16]
MALYDYITAQGVIVPDTSELLEDVRDEWREAFGQDLIVSPETPQGVLITAEVEARDAVVRNNAELANQINPDLAGGVFLDAIWRLTGGQRIGATRSLILGAVASGVPGTIIPAGSLASVQGTGALFETTGAAAIGAGGTVTVNLQSVVTGPIAAPAGQLVNVATAVLGWETITNPSDAILGRNQQSDIQSRRLRRNTLALQGVALPEAITSRLYMVEGVRSLFFQENVASTTEVINGVSMIPHSIYVCVEGGTDQDIAEALLATKSLGAGWNGNTTVNVVDPASGQGYDVAFQRPDAVPVFARVTARFNGLDGTSIIRSAIIAYKDGELDGDPGFTVGADVSPWELAGAINQVEPRIFVTLVELSTDGVTYSTSSVPITVEQIATISESSIQVVPA